MIRSLAFSPDGKFIASGSGGGANRYLKGELKVWDVATRQHVFVTEEDQWVKALAFSPDGTWLAVGMSTYAPAERVQARPGELKLYQFPAMREIKTVHLRAALGSLRVSKDGKRLAVVTADSDHEPEVAVLDVPDLNEQRVIPVQPRRWSATELPAVTFTEDGRDVIVREDGRIHDTPRELANANFLVAAVSPNGRWMVGETAKDNRWGIVFWDSASKEASALHEQSMVRPHVLKVPADCSPDGRHVVVGAPYSGVHGAWLIRTPVP
jgi:WD40 repeat protein